MLETAVIMLGITLATFLFEVFWPSPLPIRFNRRTREVYFQDQEQLYHMPWDMAVAWMQETRTVTQYTGAMTETPLEMLLQRYGHPDEVIALRLNLPHRAHRRAAGDVLGVPALLYGEGPLVR